MLRRLGAVGLLLMLAGCLSKEAVFNDIYASRKAAYESWKSQKENQDKQPLLKGPLSINTAVELAVRNNKELLAMQLEIEAASGRVMEAASAAIPRLRLEDSFRRQNRRSESNGAPFGARDSYQQDLVLSQPLFHGGAIWAGIRGSQLYAYIAEQRVATTRQTVVFDTTRQYYDVLLAEQLVKVSQGDHDQSVAHLRDVEKKRAAGVSSEYDVLRAQVDVSNVDAQLIERQNQLHLAVTTLLKTMGVSLESKVTMSDQLTYAPYTESLDDAVKAAYENRPEILQAELAVRLNREAWREAIAGYLPQIDGNFTRTWARPTPIDSTVDKWGKSWSAGVTASLPLFDLSIPARVRQADASLRQSVIQLAGQEEQVLLDVKQALYNLQDATTLVQSQQDNLRRAKEAERLVKAGYDAGVNTELEVLDARQASSQSQAFYYQAVARYEQARLQLERAKGMLKNNVGAAHAP